MKNIYLLIVLLTFSSLAWGQEKDTLEIVFKEKTKVIIIADDKSDLEELSDYDLNKLINEALRQAKKGEEEVELEFNDEVEVGNETERPMKIDVEREKVKVRLGNLEIDVDPGDVEDWEDWEDWGDDWGENFGDNMEKSRYYESYPKNKRMFKMDFGLNNYLEDGSFPVANAPYAVKSWGSWYVSLGGINSTHMTGPLYLEWGGNVSWYNFKYQNEEYRLEKGEEEVYWENYDYLDPTKSKFGMSHVNLSLVPVIDFGGGKRLVKVNSADGVVIRRYKRNGFRVGVGAYAGYRLGSTSKLVWKDDGKKKNKEKDDFFNENWRYGIRTQLGYKGVQLFFNYDLSTIFTPNNGPELNAISFGITL